MSPRRRLIPLAVFILTFLAFLPALGNRFVNWDDTVNFLDNPLYRGLGWPQLRWMFTNFLGGHYQPLSWLTLGLDYLLWGMNPFGYHLTNLLLHCANAVLFYFLALRLLGDNSRMGSFFAALFFSLHPLRVESVAWATERRDVLCAFFYLLSLLSYLAYCDAPAGPSGARRFYAAFAACLLALLSKVTAITLPALLLILDFYPLRRGPVWAEKLPFFLAALCAGAIGLLAQASSPALVLPGDFGAAGRLAQAFYSLSFYPVKTLAPTGLTAWYPESLLSRGGELLARAAAVLALTAAVVVWRRGRPWALAAWAAYGAALFPALGIVKSGRQVVADRFSYLPCLVFALLAGAALNSCLLPRKGVGRRLCSWAAALWLAALGWATWRQTQVWHDSVRLWSRALSFAPDDSFAQINLALGLMEENRYAEALAYIERQRRVYPGGEIRRLLSRVGAGAHSNLAVDLAAQGNADEALSHFGQALDMDPGEAEIENNFGLFLYSRGARREAISHFESALRLNPRYTDAHNNLGIALAGTGRLEEAISHFHEALKLDPGHAKAAASLRLATELKKKRRPVRTRIRAW